jgi:molybdopterin-binding protein
MELSARNQLKATVKSVKVGNVMAEVVLAGDAVVAIVKATEVMLGK